MSQYINLCMFRENNNIYENENFFRQGNLTNKF